MKPFMTIMAILCLLSLGATADDKKHPPDPTQQVPAPTLQAPVTQSDTYIIGPQDVVQVTVWKEPELSTSVPVRPDGKISLSLLNDVDAAGLTPTQLAQSITAKLARYIEEPRVSVIVTQINSRRVYVLGQVARPGAMPLTPDMTVLQAISTAGGLSQFSDGKKAYILRFDNGVQIRIPVNYKQLVKGDKMDANVLLKSGDTIVVP